MIPAAFDPFLQEAPLCVMARLTLESLFDPDRLDALFRRTAQRQNQKELLFSQVVERMTAVVLRVQPSVLAAYKKRSLPVSDQALYDKLRCRELDVSAALVADAAAQIAPVLDRVVRPPAAVAARLPHARPGRQPPVRHPASPQEVAGHLGRGAARQGPGRLRTRRWIWSRRCS